MRMRWVVLLVTMVAMVTIGATGALAQTTGTIFGTVADESKALIPGVTVTVTNVDTGLTRTATTDAEGRYQVPNLPPGNYELELELDVLPEAQRKMPIELKAGETLEIKLN